METSQFAQRVRWGTAGVVVAVLSACGGDDGGPSGPQAVTAQQACDALSGKTIAGATLTTVTVAASGAAPTYCKATGTIAPKLNFEMRLPQTWNGKLYYGGGGGYNGSIPGLTGTNLTALLQDLMAKGYLQRSAETAIFTIGVQVPRPSQGPSYIMP